MTKTTLRSGRNDKDYAALRPPMTKGQVGSAAEKHTGCLPKNGHLFLPHIGREAGGTPKEIDRLHGVGVEIAAVACGSFAMTLSAHFLLHAS